MASGGDTGGPGGTRGNRGVGPNASGAAAGRNHGLESGSRKRKTIEPFEASCEDSQKISIEIENLRSQLDEDVKELGHCEENEKLRVEMDLKNKEIQCLRNQIEELQAKYKDLHIKYEEQSEEELNTRIITWSRKASTRASIRILQILENQIDTKRKQRHHLERLYSAMEFPPAQLEEGKRIPDKSCNEDSRSKLLDESSAEKCVNWKADNEKLKRLQLEVAELDAEIQIKMEKLGEMLDREKFTEELASVTVWKSIQTNMELQEFRKGLMEGLKDVPLRYMNIGIKRMGEINYLPLRTTCLMKYGKDDAEVNADLRASVWSQELRKPSWHPFKIVETDGKLKEIINDDDAKLKFLQNEFGHDVCDAMKTALMEMNEYNPSERQPVLEFWNFGKGRKATVEEILMFVFSHLDKRHHQA